MVSLSTVSVSSNLIAIIQDDSHGEELQYLLLACCCHWQLAYSGWGWDATVVSHVSRTVSICQNKMSVIWFGNCTLMRLIIPIHY